MNFWITLFLCILLLFLIRIIYVRYCVRPIVRGSVVFREKFCFLPILYNFAEPAVATVGQPTDQSPWLRISSGSEL